MSKRPLTGLHYGDRIVIEAIGLGVKATATYLAYSGGSTAFVQLDGTDELVNVPRTWIKREEKE